MSIWQTSGHVQKFDVPRSLPPVLLMFTLQYASTACDARPHSVIPSSGFQYN